MILQIFVLESMPILTATGGISCTTVRICSLTISPGQTNRHSKNYLECPNTEERVLDKSIHSYAGTNRIRFMGRILSLSAGLILPAPQINSSLSFYIFTKLLSSKNIIFVYLFSFTVDYKLDHFLFLIV